MRFSEQIKKAGAALAAAVLCLTAAPSVPRAEAAGSPRDAVQEISDAVGLVCNLYVAGSSQTADNAALQWATVKSAKQYTLYRSTDAETGFLPVYQGTGTSFSDRKLTAGQPYYYQLCVSDGKSDSWSGVKSVTPCAVPDGLDTYDNQKGSSLHYATGGYKVGNTYYSYSLKKHSGQNDIYLEETTSSDGKFFGNARNVADSSQNSALASCKIESVHIDYLPWANKVVVWAHWEKPDGYSDGKALVITGTPGQSFTVHHVYNPLDIEVRDMAIFFDDDAAHTGYLIAAANTHSQSANATLYIFRMNESYSDVTAVVQKLFADQYREFPNLIKQNGHYFLFTSQAAGWYPSSGAYAVADDIAGEWSGLRSIGNSSTFSSQSGWIVNLQDKNYLMHAYRWKRASSTSGTTLCPLYFDGSFAFYDYCPSFRYSTATGDLYPVQAGELLSQDRPASSSLAAKSGNDAAKAFDGSYQTSFTAIDEHKRWPYYLQVDLEQDCELANIQISWYICKGSEGYYTYTVEGSTDGEHWTKLLDHTDKNSDVVNSTYGFNSDFLEGKARFVRLNVQGATLQNNPNNNWYTPTVYEVKVFGRAAGAAESPVPAVQYDFASAAGGTVPDLTGNGGDLTLKGGAAVASDPVMGNVLRLSADPADYAVLPAGLLDGVREYTVLMDARSDSDGDFFTFAAGQDENKYAFFKIAKDHFRFQTTTDTWKGESGFRVDLDAADWHRYCLVVSGGSGTLYVDGKPVGGTADLTTGPADMGKNLLCYFGKSFYKDDTGFAGAIDNAAVYRRALTPDEVKALSGGTGALRGDVSADGTVSIADAVMLQKFLLCEGTVTDWQAGDLDGNRRLNAVDFALLKRILISGSH
ncbi:MAG: discoidin domain-containing protein [Oscillospiraceae bacterium]|nr:discoidin domain-containing protein [Oscillospiraceae bacterium]